MADTEEGLQLRYFVLNPKSKFKDDPYAEASRKAMREYSMSIRQENLTLAKELYDWADREAQNNIRLPEVEVSNGD